MLVFWCHPEVGGVGCDPKMWVLTPFCPQLGCRVTPASSAPPHPRGVTILSPLPDKHPTWIMTGERIKCHQLCLPSRQLWKLGKEWSTITTTSQKPDVYWCYTGGEQNRFWNIWSTDIRRRCKISHFPFLAALHNPKLLDKLRCGLENISGQFTISDWTK